MVMVREMPAAAAAATTAAAKRRRRRARNGRANLAGRQAAARRAGHVAAGLVAHERAPRALRLDGEVATAVLRVALRLADLEQLGHLHGRLARRPYLLDLAQHGAQLVEGAGVLLLLRQLLARLHNQQPDVHGA